MTNEERKKAIYDRMDRILESVPDNPVYEEHEARSVASYLQCIKLLDEQVFFINKEGVTKWLK